MCFAVTVVSLQALAANALSARAFVNTQNATAVSMLAWNLWEVIFSSNGLFKGHPTAVGAACGAVTGLVVITPACGYVDNMWAFFIGAFGSFVVYFTPTILKPLGVDDRLDCFAFHGIGGITGSLLTGLFATVHSDNLVGGANVDGAFYYNAPLYAKQIVSILVTVLLSVVMTTAIYWVLWVCAKICRTDMRIPDEEQHDPDASQHGERAYSRGLEEFKAERAGAAAPKTTSTTGTVETIAPRAPTADAPPADPPVVAVPAVAV